MPKKQKLPLIESSRLSENVLEYYMKFGKERELEKFMRFRSPKNSPKESTTTTSASSNEEWTRGGNLNHLFSEKLSSIHAADKKAKCQSMPTISNTSSEPKERVVPIQLEDIKNSSEDNIPSTSQSPVKTPPRQHTEHTKQTQTPESIVKAHKRLEWDSLADVGYRKSKSTSNISIVERMLLREFFEVNSDAPKPTNSSESDIRLLEQEIADLRILKNHFTKPQPEDESKYNTPPLASSTQLETKSSESRNKVKSTTVGTNTSTLLQKFEKYAQTSIRSPETKSQEVQVTLTSTCASSYLGSSAEPSSFEYHSRPSNNNSCSRKSPRSPKKAGKRKKAGESKNPYDKNDNDMEQRKALGVRNVDRPENNSNKECNELHRLYCTWQEMLGEDKENSSSSSATTTVSSAPAIELGIQLICAIMKANAIDSKQKKKLVKNIVKRITKIANSRELHDIVTRTSLLYGSETEDSRVTQADKRDKSSFFTDRSARSLDKFRAHTSTVPAPVPAHSKPLAKNFSSGLQFENLIESKRFTNTNTEKQSSKQTSESTTDVDARKELQEMAKDTGSSKDHQQHQTHQRVEGILSNEVKTQKESSTKSDSHSAEDEQKLAKNTTSEEIQRQLLFAFKSDQFLQSTKVDLPYAKEQQKQLLDEIEELDHAIKINVRPIKEQQKQNTQEAEIVLHKEIPSTHKSEEYGLNSTNVQQKQHVPPIIVANNRHSVVKDSLESEQSTEEQNFNTKKSAIKTQKEMPSKYEDDEHFSRANKLGSRSTKEQKQQQQQIPTNAAGSQKETLTCHTKDHQKYQDNISPIYRSKKKISKQFQYEELLKKAIDETELTKAQKRSIASQTQKNLSKKLSSNQAQKLAKRTSVNRSSKSAQTPQKSPKRLEQAQSHRYIQIIKEKLKNQTEKPSARILSGGYDQFKKTNKKTSERRKEQEKEIFFANKQHNAASNQITAVEFQSTSSSTISTTTSTTTSAEQPKGMQVTLSLAKDGRLISATATEVNIQTSSTATTSTLTTTTSWSSSIDPPPRPIQKTAQPKDNVNMQEWLEPMTQSEIDFEKKKRATALAKRSRSKNKLNDKCREVQLNWIDCEIERLRNLRQILIKDNSTTTSKEADLQTETVKSQQNRHQQEQQHQPQISKASQSPVTQNSEKVYDTVYSDKSRTKSNASTPTKKSIDIDPPTSKAISPKPIENASSSKQRSKIDTPTSESYESESVESLIRRRKQKLLDHYQQSKTQYCCVGQIYNDGPSTSAAAAAACGGGIYSMPHTIQQTIPSTYYTYPPSTQIPMQMQMQHQAQTQATAKATRFQIIQRDQQQTPSSVFCGSSELTVPMGSYRISSTPTTTHQYDDVATATAAAVAAAAAIRHNINVGSQTGPSLQRSKPIYETRCSSNVMPYATYMPSCSQGATNTVCLQAQPRATAYAVQFVVRDQSGSSSNSASSTTTTLTTASSTSQELRILAAQAGPSLQLALQQRRPEFLQHAKARKSVINKIQQMRQEREKQLREIADDNLSVTSLDKKLQNLPPPATERLRLFSTKQMKAMTKKHVANLPEVVSGQDRKRDERSKRSNRLLRDVYNRRLQQRVRKGKLDLQHSRTLI